MDTRKSYWDPNEQNNKEQGRSQDVTEAMIPLLPPPTPLRKIWPATKKQGLIFISYHLNFDLNKLFSLNLNQSFCIFLLHI